MVPVFDLACWNCPHFPLVAQSRQSVPDVSIMEVNTKRVEQLPLMDFAVTDFGSNGQEFGFEMGPACFFWTGIVWNTAVFSYYYPTITWGSNNRVGILVFILLPYIWHTNDHVWFTWCTRFTQECVGMHGMFSPSSLFRRLPYQVRTKPSH